MKKQQMQWTLRTRTKSHITASRSSCIRAPVPFLVQDSPSLSCDDLQRTCNEIVHAESRRLGKQRYSCIQEHG